jgi:hypothetical protein
MLSGKQDLNLRAPASKAGEDGLTPPFPENKKPRLYEPGCANIMTISAQATRVGKRELMLLKSLHITNVQIIFTCAKKRGRWRTRPPTQFPRCLVFKTNRGSNATASSSLCGSRVSRTPRANLTRDLQSRPLPLRIYTPICGKQCNRNTSVLSDNPFSKRLTALPILLSKYSWSESN